VDGFGEWGGGRMVFAGDGFAVFFFFVWFFLAFTSKKKTFVSLTFPLSKIQIIITLGWFLRGDGFEGVSK
jgi:hypothetical protein